MPSAAVTKRLTLAGLSAALTAACSPLSMFATLSPKDATAPTLTQAREQGLLPSYAACQEFYASLT